MRGIVIIGAGGHGREIYGLLHHAGVACYGFLDDAIPKHEVLSRINAKYLGPISEYQEHVGDAGFLIGIGSSKTRQKLALGLVNRSASPPIYHPNASIDLDVRAAPGSVIFANATVTTNISIGMHTHVGRGSAVGHDTILGDFVTVMPLASISGSVVVGERCTIGTGAIIRQGQVIGAGATIGAGAVVVDDVEPGVTVVGNPARPMDQRNQT